MSKKVKDGLFVPIVDMLPEDRELSATRFVGADLGDVDDTAYELLDELEKMKKL